MHPKCTRIRHTEEKLGPKQDLGENPQAKGVLMKLECGSRVLIPTNRLTLSKGNSRYFLQQGIVYIYTP